MVHFVPFFHSSRCCYLTRVKQLISTFVFFAIFLSSQLVECTLLSVNINKARSHIQEVIVLWSAIAMNVQEAGIDEESGPKPTTCDVTFNHTEEEISLPWMPLKGKFVLESEKWKKVRTDAFKEVHQLYTNYKPIFEQALENELERKPCEYDSLVLYQLMSNLPGRKRLDEIRGAVVEAREEQEGLVEVDPETKKKAAGLENLWNHYKNTIHVITSQLDGFRCRLSSEKHWYITKGPEFSKQMTKAFLGKLIELPLLGRFAKKEAVSNMRVGLSIWDLIARSINFPREIECKDCKKDNHLGFAWQRFPWQSMTTPAWTEKLGELLDKAEARQAEKKKQQEAAYNLLNRFHSSFHSYYVYSTNKLRSQYVDRFSSEYNHFFLRLLLSNMPIEEELDQAIAIAERMELYAGCAELKKEMREFFNRVLVQVPVVDHKLTEAFLERLAPVTEEMVDAFTINRLDNESR